jgi:signal transduction histidine kinase/ligand-binding sensor domain-containing protein
MHSVRPIALSFLLSILPIAHGEGAGHPYAIRTFNVEDGLSQGSITCILQDHQGFLWVGTRDGLNRFDGMEFETFRHSAHDSTSLSSNTILCLYEDRERVLWVGTESGLNRCDPVSGGFIRCVMVREDSARTTDYLAQSMCETRAGSDRMLWVGGYTLYLLDPLHNELRPAQVQVTGDPPLMPATMIDDHDTLLYVGCALGTYSVNLRTNTMSRSGPPREVTCLLADGEAPERGLWVGTAEGLIAPDGRKYLASSFVTSLAIDAHHRIWVGASRGLFMIGTEGPVRIGSPDDGGNPDRLSDSYVSNLFVDAAGAVWAGTYNGLNMVDERAPVFTTYKHVDGDRKSPASSFILPILEDRKGDVWFGSFHSGVTIAHRTPSGSFEFRSLQKGSSRRGLSGNAIRSMVMDDQGRVWIGTDRGLDRYDPLTRSVTKFASAPPGVRSPEFWVESLCLGHDGTIWAGTTELVKIERSQQQRSGGSSVSPSVLFTAYSFHLDSLQSFELRDIIEDRHHNIWVATERGLVCFDPRTGQHIRFVNNPADSCSLSDNSVWVVYEDPDDSSETLWIGTADGLNRLDPADGSFTRYPAGTGFPSAFVYGILKDDTGRLWLSTNHGITCFDRRLPEERQFKNYDADDGLQGNEFNRRSFCRLRSGEFLFGGTHGVTRFDPDRIHDNSYIPPVAITAFSLFGNPRPLDRDAAGVPAVELRYDENDFAFEFVALGYTNPKKNMYAYMMEGFDPGWHYSGGRRYARYTHLDPGQYLFRVKASNNDGMWNERGAVVAVNISPPFWSTWWFRLCAALSFFATGYLFYRSRIQQVEREKKKQEEFSLRLMEHQEKERKRIAGELHDSLGQNLLVMKTGISQLVSRVRLTAPVRKKLEQLADMAVSTIQEVREISYDLHPHILDRLGLTKALEAMITRLSDLPMAVEKKISNIDGCLPKNVEINVYRISQELMNNIVKHSGATVARFEVSHSGSGIEIIARDNGRGPGTEQTRLGGGGFGIINISERVKLMHGTFTLRPALPEGTIAHITIPITPRHGVSA